ncbi:MAG: tRNA (adenosine(37)-N6)-threonylcarbamoyltransferase complex dimerization subunit type 1 TsaB [Chloroflexota bacterium]|nr:tRNA (adenosine(37)-N6)-threonylcarbamoyltransferase complex dimerization subunit type 1 TsaB [Chloroflexota bacterium]
MLLAIDSSTRYAGIALHSSDGPVAAHLWRADRMHTVQLMPAVDALMREAGLSPADLVAVGVAVGPGSFTGVRVGLSLAKGLALSLALPLIGVSTLLYTAWPHRHWGLPIRAILPLGRRRLAVAHYAPTTEGGLHEEWAANVSPAGAVVPGRIVYCGELTDEVRAVLGQQRGATVLPLAEGLRRPEVLGALAWERMMRGETDDVATLQAVYLESD